MIGFEMSDRDPMEGYPDIRFLAFHELPRGAPRKLFKQL